MKQRHGFVSNSSATSFGVYGIQVDSFEDALEAICGEEPEPKEVKTKGCDHDFDREKCKFCPECGNSAWNIDIEDPWEEPQEVLNDILGEHGLEYIYAGAMPGFIGFNLQAHGKKAAANDFQALKDTRDKIKELFGVEAEFHAGSDYDG